MSFKKITAALCAFVSLFLIQASAFAFEMPLLLADEAAGGVHYIEDISYEMPLTEKRLTVGEYEYESYSDLTQITGYTGEELERCLAGSGLEGLGSYYAQKEDTHGINALFLMAVATLESGKGGSFLAKEQNNIGGLKDGKGGWLAFERKEDCVEYMASLLKKKYLTEGAPYYKGKTTKDVSVIYCEQSESWHSQVETIMERYFNAIKEG